MQHLSPKHSDRPWGFFDEFIQDEPCTVKLITVRAHEALSLQYHHKRQEFWVIISGNGHVTIGDNREEVKKGDQYEIKKGQHHRVEAGSEDLMFLEIATGEFNEDDIVRLEDKYGRIST